MRDRSDRSFVLRDDRALEWAHRQVFHKGSEHQPYGVHLFAFGRQHQLETLLRRADRPRPGLGRLRQ